MTIVQCSQRARSPWLSLSLSLSLALALPVATVAWSSAAIAQKPVALAIVDVKVVALGYRVSQLIGRPVTNPAGEKIGTIDDFIVQRDKVLITIISVGGFLGIGERKVAIPYRSLMVTPEHIILPGATKAAVGKLPPFAYR